MGTRIDCPHCATVIAADPIGAAFTERYEHRVVVPDEDGFRGVEYQLSTCCNRYFVHISDGQGKRYLIWPNSTVIQSINDLVPAKYAVDYQEATAVLSISPKASAALTRRCLQHFLEGELNAKVRDNLEKQIQYAIALTPPIFPRGLAEKLDHIRIIGNFAAHPKKSTNTGEVIDVEPDEAHYLLDVLGDVFVHHFVEPVAHAAWKVMIGEKEAATKKPRS